MKKEGIEFRRILTDKRGLILHGVCGRPVARVASEKEVTYLVSLNNIILDYNLQLKLLTK